jgi:hypothetical protein
MPAEFSGASLKAKLQKKPPLAGVFLTKGQPLLAFFLVVSKLVP